ncbi:prolyl oligopeptidase family serine peptidase [Fulvivirgaceae bacterium PWU4]|uniref:prolyl oligopeptidase n=1 Tax=Chryseosolibacter histidini TaxID=2782349 RepID=A0AAP2DP28_9BACT|nr:prolyl oligopeptidase family serine peptidase [Chryseosolibacter histidini]MBT1699851.1 prolyl oligopeptidase family serine peptidase [Chryseosolibacter histidini]
MKLISLLALGLPAAVFVSCNTPKETAPRSVYPMTKKVDTVDTYHGVAVSDPYRWLENDTTQETAQWVEAQNDVTFAYLKNINYRDRVLKRLESIYNYERLGAPSREGDHYYYFKNDGLQNHSVLYRKKGINGTPEVFLDPNTFSKDGTTGLSGIFFTKDGALATYLISEGGSDWRKAVVIRTADKTIVEDSLQDIKFSGIAWKGNEGFYYSSYDKPKGSELSAKTQHHKLFYHKLGTPQSQDKLVFGGEETPRRYIGAYLTDDERFLVVSAATSTTGNELYVQDLKDPKGHLVAVVNNFDNDHEVLTNVGTRLLIHTNLNAPNNRIVVVDFSNPTPEHWKDLIPETENVMKADAAGNRIFANYMVDVKTEVKQFDFNGKLEREIELPGIGTATGFKGKPEDKELYYSFTSFTYPTTIFKYDIASGKSALYEKPKVDFNPEDYETKQVFYESKDGTKIPMFIVYKKGLELNGKNPTWLYAYGGFSVSLTPSFATSRVVWLENGGIYAQPNLRGGGEYGEKWHLAGTKLNKQNVFDDFIAAGEYLIKEKYTSSEYLAISGGSNGGLLVGATMTQRPDLAKVAFPAVGVMDMLRYHKFTAGAGWAYDYGTADDSKEMFEYLKKYSPVHALKAGVKYPATLITTADHDDRVVPAHSFKFAATLQEHHQGENPVLIRVDVKSGHSSSNLKKSLEVTADQYAFAWYNMGVVPPLAKDDM